jgi:uncharacterized protein (UPF0276 family)
MVSKKATMNNCKREKKYPYLGFGLGLRTEHYQTILDELPKVDWFEVLTENYLVPGGKPLYYLDQIRQHYKMVMHGVSLSIGSTDPIDYTYLKEVKELIHRIEPVWISDHLCWTGVNGYNTHDLLPLPYTEQAIDHVVSKIKQVQDFLGQQILIENLSTYLTFKNSEMTEWEFLATIANRADCYILLDINNIYVSAFNHGFDPIDYLAGIPVERICQHHLAGHSNQGDYIVDTHDAPIIDPVWNLYTEAVQRYGRVSTMIERDDHIPPLKELLIELAQAQKLADNVCLEFTNGH